MGRNSAAGWWIAALVVAGGGVAWLGPAVADESHDHGSPPAVLEEPVGEPEPELPKVLVTRDYLVEYEASLDPAGSAATYVCANEGDETLMVVAGKEAPADAVADPDPGPGPEKAGDLEPLDPCHGKSLIVGKEQRR